MSAEERKIARPAAGGGLLSGWKIYVAIFAIAFLLGFVPMWLRARDAAAQRDGLARQLQSSQIKNALAAAAIEARRGEYELARQAASEYFTTLRAQLDAGGETLSAAQRSGLNATLNQRDEVITLLARSDPAAADRLVNLYVAHNQAMSGRQ